MRFLFRLLGCLLIFLAMGDPADITWGWFLLAGVYMAGGATLLSLAERWGRHEQH